ncbi:MAG: patatin-like phospholipase family protein [Burkholderiales bacterium]
MPDSTTKEPFEIGLVMAGAVSAGAYSAGVLDFLVEALDAWERAKQDDPAGTPQHDVALKVVSGASAGSITGAILAACIKYEFPHVTPGNRETQGRQNPLYDSWVNQIDISHLLGTRDIADGKRAVSLLDSTVLLDIARNAMDYGAGVPEIRRPWLCDPMRFLFTLTNLRGVPFHYTLGSNAALGQDMIRHGECIRFALKGLGERWGRPMQNDEYAIEYPAGTTEKWPIWGPRFATAALASGAFPVGLAPRELVRRTADYDGEPVLLPGGPDEPASVERIEPHWTPGVNPKPEPDYTFVCVDGGTINNEPLNLARVELANGDIAARNERDGAKARRAVLMIDPFAGAERPGPATVAELDLAGSVFNVFGALKNQARFNPLDVALASSETIYSRFMIAPSRPGADAGASGNAIACGSLGGFGGFLSQHFREHDFFLGRRNCQRFLQRHFTLLEVNPLFDSWGDNEPMRARYRVRNPKTDEAELPIIPLVPAVHPDANPQQGVPWPHGVVDPRDYCEGIGARLDAIYDSFVSGGRGLLLKLGWVFYLKPKLLGLVLEKVESGLVAHKLIDSRREQVG